jgi:DNA-binding NarL/FixJ family response regulator
MADAFVVPDMTMTFFCMVPAAQATVPCHKGIFLTMPADVAYAKEAFKAGFSGYLLKPSAA